MPSSFSDWLATAGPLAPGRKLVVGRGRLALFRGDASIVGASVQPSCAGSSSPDLPLAFKTGADKYHSALLSR
jgi:hypothetical protein